MAGQAKQLWFNLLALGMRRLLALGVIGLSVFALVGLVGFYLSRPDLEVLYAGLERDDVGQIGSILKEAGIDFDVSSAGDSVLVQYGQAGRARMLLAENGLPNSANAGYELFDDLGSLGLTSFMQEVTKVRALEGEIARTIQLMKGVKAARVHIVLPDKGSFRRDRQPPSASVVLRTETVDDFGSAQVIRHLVAAAIPGMALDQVTVLNTDGTLLASGGDAQSAAPGNMMSLEKKVGEEVEENIRRTLVPYLGLANFQISVAARLNTDKKQVSETIFDPESRVERSTRVIKENEVSQNLSTQTPTTAEQNLAEEEVSADGGHQESAQNERREELTNYELSSKTVTTTSEGYGIENLSIAVLLNRAQLAAAIGGNGTPEQLDAQIADIQRLVASAAGFSESRGDQINISAVDFLADSRDMEPVPSIGLMELVARQAGTVVNAATILVVSVLLIWFGLRPATKAILEHRALPKPAEAAATAEPAPAALQGAFPPQLAGVPENLIEDLTSKLSRSPQRRLEQMIEFDDQRAAAILRQWLHQEEAA